MTIDQVAKLCHEVNRMYCEILEEPGQTSWESAPEWQQTSALKGVRFHLDNPGALPSQSHESWLSEKERTGWKYGPVKNAECKEHPCFVPFDELPETQKAKDVLFHGIVNALRGLVVI